MWSDQFCALNGQYAGLKMFRNYSVTQKLLSRSLTRCCFFIYSLQSTLHFFFPQVNKHNIFSPARWTHTIRVTWSWSYCCCRVDRTEWGRAVWHDHHSVSHAVMFPIKFDSRGMLSSSPGANFTCSPGGTRCNVVCFLSGYNRFNCLGGMLIQIIKIDLCEDPATRGKQIAQTGDFLCVDSSLWIPNCMM